MAENIWDERYAGEDYHFGTAPNDFLTSQHALLKPGMRCLAVADGEGRNGVWLAEQGLQVVAMDSSPVATAKARKLAQEHGVKVEFEVADVLGWECGEASYDVVVAIFIQFLSPEQRGSVFARLKRALKPGGLFLLQGYTPRQLDFRSGGPSQADNLYSEPVLRSAFADMQILHLSEHVSFISEGEGHYGVSALIDVVAQKFR